jgi:hypothetical protein
MAMIRSAEPLGRQHGQQTDRTITHHGNRLVGTYFGGDRAEQARTEHVRGGKEARDEVSGGNFGGRHECAVS